MKKTELEKCISCDKGMGHDRAIAFYQLTVQRMLIDRRAVERQHGLELAMGSPALASIMGPDEDIAVPVGGAEKFLVCDECAMDPQILAMLDEKAAQRKAAT